METSHDVTKLLLQWGKGDELAPDDLFPLDYREPHRIAHRYLSSEYASNTLQTTALIHKAYLKLIDQTRVSGRTARIFRCRGTGDAAHSG